MTETESAPVQQWAQATLPTGTVIHVNGIPFRIDAPVLVRGHPANLPLAGLLPNSPTTPQEILDRLRKR